VNPAMMGTPELKMPMISVHSITEKDVPALVSLILELAEYEHLDVVTTEKDLLRDGFGANRKFRALIAEYDGKPAGYAMFYDFYSSFRGRCGLFLEDIYVQPALRNKGIGKALLAHVAKISREENYFGMQWEVLDWNRPSIEFYERIGGKFMDEWRLVSLTGDALQKVAEGVR
jgi:GNAT superfamily N-acetyltransferase